MTGVNPGLIGGRIFLIQNLQTTQPKTFATDDPLTDHFATVDPQSLRINSYEIYYRLTFEGSTFVKY